MSVVEIAGVKHRYGLRQSLNGVDLQVPEGAVYALLGSNGAGKTTLLRILMGLQQPSAGSVTVFGKPRAKLTLADRARIGYVAEGQKLPRGMSIGALEQYLAPLYPTWDQALADDLRVRFELDRSQKVGTLSKGQYMKTALLCALAPRPRLLVMDEPFTGMDVAVRDELIRGVLLGVGAEGWTVIVSSHDVGELETIADWVGFLDRGVMKFSKPIDELRDEYRGTVEPPSLREIFIAVAKGSMPVPAQEVAS
jgi:ABC-2 type transport system ATP-binding protein